MNPLHIPATALDGALLSGWTGPVHLRTDTVGYALLASFRRTDGLFGYVCASCTDPSVTLCAVAENIRLNPARPEVAHRIADVLRALGHEVGHFLPVALGGRVVDAVVMETCEACGGDGVHTPVASCISCRGLGKHREGATITPLGCNECSGTGRGNSVYCATCSGPGAPVTGKIRRIVPAAEVSARLLVACVAGVEAGKGVVRGLLSDWDEACGVRCGVRWDRHGCAVAVGDDPIDADFADLPPARNGWRIQALPGNILASGPETGAEGRACADAALLQLGFAYLDPGAPGGVRVPTWEGGA